MNLESHDHQFDDSEWPFSDPTNTTSFTTRQVLIDGLPILLVSHDDDGDWQFLCDTTTDTADLKVICLGCAFQRDRSVGELADLPLGWIADRKSIHDPWERFQNLSAVQSEN